MTVRRLLLHTTAACLAATALTALVPAGTAQAACTTSSFTVVWDYAGMYTAPNESTLYGTRRYGQVVTGPTGTPPTAGQSPTTTGTAWHSGPT